MTTAMTMTTTLEDIENLVCERRDELLNEQSPTPLAAALDQLAARLASGDSRGTAVEAMAVIAAFANAFGLLESALVGAPLVLAGTPWWRCIDEKTATIQ